MAYKSRWTNETYETYDDMTYADERYTEALQVRLGRKLSYSEKFDGKISQTEDRDLLTRSEADCWQPKLLTDKKDPLEKIRDECYSAHDEATELARREPDTKKSLAMFAQIEIDKRKQSKALAKIDAERPTPGDLFPEQLELLRQFQNELKVTDVGMSESSAVERAITQMTTKDADPQHAAELFETVLQKRVAREVNHNADIQSQIKALESKLIQHPEFAAAAQGTVANE